MRPELDYRALFAATPSPYLVLGTDLVVVDVNDAYCRATGRCREELVGQHLFVAFPDNPMDRMADGVRNLRASLERVLETGKPDTMGVQRYDIPVTARPGTFEERWWSPVNTPVHGPDGQVAYLIHRVEDVTDFLRTRGIPSSGRWAERAHSERAQSMEAELYVRARELQRLNDELRAAHARERQVAVTLQEAMLHSPDLARHEDVAVRYLPAVGSLNVCGDWYDTVDLADGRFSVAVGDVVGHGLEAATIMGMMRSALSAASRAVSGPAQALEVLGLYARSVEGALATTAVTALIDTHSKLIVYSSAGHPPPVLLSAQGSCRLLDQATDPPLGARPEHVPRPQAGTAYGTGDTLVLYTDGLIERRDEDIDSGLDRLTEALTTMRHLSPQRLADALLARLGVAGGARDDVALVVVRL
ncbi:PP2C family protein-serine/threonine phosphatase [Streptomyces yunnanensis]|uniref:PAS domain S-box-containing protein n=1 Tax=Streptomyces yunnanensis TaxID=156453 RepID=A0A9X8QYZ2_9ACTN|nr:SpoIIE family protein phosphatase [Streptomyces yunnanensis]SHN16639.1 PAS domain S-box-containing protein [Streptomyces yunnanensis]